MRMRVRVAVLAGLVLLAGCETKRPPPPPPPPAPAPAPEPAPAPDGSPSAAELAGPFEVSASTKNALADTLVVTRVQGTAETADLTLSVTRGKAMGSGLQRGAHLDRVDVAGFLKRLDAQPWWTLANASGAPEAPETTVTIRRSGRSWSFVVHGCACDATATPAAPCACPQREVAQVIERLPNALPPPPVEVTQELPFMAPELEGDAVAKTCHRGGGLITCGSARCFGAGPTLSCFTSPFLDAPGERVKPTWDKTSKAPAKSDPPLPADWFWAFELSDGTHCQDTALDPQHPTWTCDFQAQVANLRRAGATWVMDVLMPGDAKPRPVPLARAWH